MIEKDYCTCPEPDGRAVIAYTSWELLHPKPSNEYRYVATGDCFPKFDSLWICLENGKVVFANAECSLEKTRVSHIMELKNVT